MISVAVQLALDLGRAERPGDLLVGLRDLEIALRSGPRTLGLGRDDPEQRRAPARALAADGLGLVRFPILHREGVRDHPRARLEVQDLRAQLDVDLGQQEHRDDRRLREVGLVEVGLEERCLGGDVLLGGIGLRQLDHVGVVLDPHGGRAALRGGDNGAAVARPEVHDEVLRRHLGHVEHLVHERLRCRHPHHVLARLSDFRFKRLLRRLLCRCRLRMRADGQQADPKGQPGPPDHTSCIH